MWGKLRWYTTQDGLDQIVVAIRHIGWSVQCPFCNWRGRSFYPHPPPHVRPNAVCPRCQAKERHRLLYLYLRQRTDLFRKPMRLLEIAPGRYSYWLFPGLPGVMYVTCDLMSDLAMFWGDITALPLANAAFDMVICYHVLEHVPDDRGAMRELLRMVVDDGMALIHVPIDRKVTLEDPAASSPGIRRQLFGQSDHVRAYGEDFTDRLREAGFTVDVDRFASTVPERVIRHYGLLRDDLIYVCWRKER
jgi:SAM-dependent methyltransferase